jgi:hypothetical protein
VAVAVFPIQVRLPISIPLGGLLQGGLAGLLTSSTLHELKKWKGVRALNL